MARQGYFSARQLEALLAWSDPDQSRHLPCGVVLYRLAGTDHAVTVTEVVELEEGEAKEAAFPDTACVGNLGEWLGNPSYPVRVPAVIPLDQVQAFLHGRLGLERLSAGHRAFQELVEGTTPAPRSPGM